MSQSTASSAQSSSPEFDLECRALNKDFDGFQAVKDISFTVPTGTFFSILGPSGCGKTTLLRMIAGFQNPSSGDLLIKGKSMIGVPPNKRPCLHGFSTFGAVPDDGHCCQCRFGLRQRGVPREDIAKRVETVLERVGLPRRRFPATSVSYLAVRSSAWPSPAAWCWSQTSCCSMNRSARSI